jgi:hypothetical protein
MKRALVPMWLVGIVAALAVTGTLGGCAAGNEVIPEQVPVTYKEVGNSPGHIAHQTRKIQCTECHGPSGFERPPVEICVRCHVTQPTPLHPGTRGPTCKDCHRFGAPPPGDERTEELDSASRSRAEGGGPGGVRPRTVVPREEAQLPCLRCHATPQGPVHAIGPHATQKCTTCHRPHKMPSLTPPPCTDCHKDKETVHAGTRGCRDCHRAHDDPRTADGTCETCHEKQTGPKHVDDHAITAGHTKCTGCHQPHNFGKAQVQPCTEKCHKDQPVLAKDHHVKCVNCHNQHDDHPKPCASCHQQQVRHPASAKGPCAGCHQPHNPNLPLGGKAVACQTCHEKQRHGTATCTDCHVPHQGKPQMDGTVCARCHANRAESTAHTKHANCVICHTAHGPKPTPGPELCAKCHADKVKTTAGTGHGTCAKCHADGVHAPGAERPACATCHKAEAATVPEGHATCVNCHKPHDPTKAPVACGSCHTTKLQFGHGKVLPCGSCHRPHGPNGLAKPPTCLTCHDAKKLPNLHKSPSHAGACTTCHGPHEAKPKSDRATCLSCHKDRDKHEPTAATCAGCHPFHAGEAKSTQVTPVTPITPPATPAK